MKKTQPAVGVFPRREPGSLRHRPWRRFLKGPDATLLEGLYVPALEEAIRYDRCCAYFSSSVLAAAARGFGKLIERLEGLADTAPRPAVRLVVNEELSAEDVRALTETGDVAALEQVLKRRFKSATDALEKNRLAMLGWLVKKGLLEVRVGVMRRGQGIVHAKFGIATDDAGEAVVFSGSGNESAQGLMANYERLEVSTSWEDPTRHAEYTTEFETLWNDTHTDVHTLPLPEALRLKLVKLAPSEPPVLEPSSAVERQRVAMLWRFIVEAPFLPNGGPACDSTSPVSPWPHQRRVADEVAGAWPEGRLLCDEVGMGKTIEAVLVLRRLLAGRGVRRALLLVPANLLGQWQAELREKGGLVVPRLEGTGLLVWPDDRSERVDGLLDALQRDVLLMSRETARTEENAGHLLAADPWDLVILDEAHAARRKRQVEGEFNVGTLLLGLLRELQLAGKTRGILLMSATPMQTHPWEPWDLLGVLGVGGRWVADFACVRDYYGAIAALKRGSCNLELARRAAVMVASDSGFPPVGESLGPNQDVENIAKAIAFARPSKRDQVAEGLRMGSPLARSMHRNTRSTLRRYYEQGLLDAPPPRRLVEDLDFDFEDSLERHVYDSIKSYIDKRFEELEKEKPGKGFVMTVYRRRASSSPLALRRSLQRRKAGLERVIRRQAVDVALGREDEPEAVEIEDLPDQEGPGRVSSALPQDPEIARRELEQIAHLLEDLDSLGNTDTKRDAFFGVLRRISDDGRPVLVFTQYVDTLEYLRDALVDHYGSALGCYSGTGGQLWDGSTWRSVAKTDITEALNKGTLRVLLCTDAASEGLNLQAAGALINFDLPWNPSRVEQRIGRIDRIGQAFREVRVVNLFLKDSIDENVYQVLRQRCGLFEHFVGAMQPVLARARRMLEGGEPFDAGALKSMATSIDDDPLHAETYLESPAGEVSEVRPSVSAEDVERALKRLLPDFGVRVKWGRQSGQVEVSVPRGLKFTMATTSAGLERDPEAVPLSLVEQRFRAIAEHLEHAGEQMPLVLGSSQTGAFRSVVAYWVEGDQATPVDSFGVLETLVDGWQGAPPGAATVLNLTRRAHGEAEALVKARVARAEKWESRALERQREAACIRLQRELGRYLVCSGGWTKNLNKVLFELVSRETLGAKRLRRCLENIGDYPIWDEETLHELHLFERSLDDNQREARLLGKELDAALDDPRWRARVLKPAQV
jgi:superfamily II DNA or RNA helicase